MKEENTHNPSDLAAEISSVNWFHSIDLGHGVVTRGRFNTIAHLDRFCLPSSLVGRSVLDIGANDGFYSFEAERRGARRVVAVDLYDREDGYPSDGFRLAHSVLQSRVERQVMSVYDFTHQDPGVFDVVLFLGVLYHLRHPLLALERVSGVTAPGGLLVLETHLDMVDVGRPAAAFYPRDELNGDFSNWWGPNQQALTAMLQDVGYSHVEFISLYAPDRATGQFTTRMLSDGDALAKALENADSARNCLTPIRVVVHAMR